MFKRVAVWPGWQDDRHHPGRCLPCCGRTDPCCCRPLPHVRLDTGGETTRPKKQATRLLKYECETCGYMVKTARKWLEEVGAPVCSVEGHGAMWHDLLDTDEGAGVKPRLRHFTTKRLSGISRLAA